MYYQMSQSMMDEVDAMSTKELCELLNIESNDSQTFTRMDIITIGTNAMFEVTKLNHSNGLDTQESYDASCRPLYAAHTLCEEKHFNLPSTES